MNMKFEETEQIILNRQINIIYKTLKVKMLITVLFQHEIPTGQQVRRSDVFIPFLNDGSFLSFPFLGLLVHQICFVCIKFIYPRMGKTKKKKKCRPKEETGRSATDLHTVLAPVKYQFVYVV